MVICRTGAQGGEETCERDKLSLFLSPERRQWFILHCNERKEANVHQQQAKYLTDQDYSESQTNNNVFRNIRFEFGKQYPWTFTIGM